MKWCKSRSSGKKQESEWTDRREATVKGVWCKREAGRGLMANDKEGEPVSAGRAWAGHRGDRGVGVGQVSGRSVRGNGQRDLAL